MSMTGRSTAENPRTVVVAMSGGVDSSVAAALLVESGFRVAGMTMLLWPEEVPGSEETCCGTVHLADARAVCRNLGIRHYTVDLQKEFLDSVVRPFVQTYLSGRTPNPCILCNERLKFHHLLHRARAIGADYLATGHYARILGDGPWRLARGSDPAKDQSYFLFSMGQDVLSQLLFPLGALKKEEVRRRARAFGLPVHEKAESQEICFVPPGGLRDFIRSRIDQLPGPGPILDTRGLRIGTHEGACFYTVGQRKGLGIAAAEPLYVARIDVERNAVILAGREEASFRWLAATGATWVSGRPPSERFRAGVQIRHRHRPAPAEIAVLGDRFEAHFDEPQHGVAPGQAAVIYLDDVVVGGGWIERVPSPGPGT